MSEVLVVGGASIGSHTNKILNRRLSDSCLDNLGYGRRDFVKWGELIEGDMADEDLLDNIFTKNKIKAVMHFQHYSRWRICPKTKFIMIIMFLKQ